MTNRYSTRQRWWYALLALPILAMLWVPAYAGGTPELAGFPFFYWYQLAWIVIGAVVTAVVHCATTSARSRGAI